MRSTMTSVQPYWVFLIIAEAKGWKIPQKKEVEVRKDYPKAEDWDRTNYIYCGQNKSSFNRIPKEYQPLMRPLLGKVVAEFTADMIEPFTPTEKGIMFQRFSALHDTCLSVEEIKEYANGKTVYGWRISDLKVYDTPKELGEFYTHDKTFDNSFGGYWTDEEKKATLKRPPQSWFYCNEVEEG